MHFLVVCVVAYHASCSVMPPVSSFKEQLAAQLFSSPNKKKVFPSPFVLCSCYTLYFLGYVVYILIAEAVT